MSSDKPKKPLTWRDLGIPEGMVKEHESPEAARIRMGSPPSEVVERTIRACAEERRQERLRNPSFIVKLLRKAGRLFVRGK